MPTSKKARAHERAVASGVVMRTYVAIYVYILFVAVDNVAVAIGV
jgi:hypothetical protein